MFSLAQKAATNTTIAELIPSGVEATISHNSVTVDGKKIDYTTNTGYLSLKNNEFLTLVEHRELLHIIVRNPRPCEIDEAKLSHGP